MDESDFVFSGFEGHWVLSIIPFYAIPCNTFNQVKIILLSFFCIQVSYHIIQLPTLYSTVSVSLCDLVNPSLVVDSYLE